MIYRPIQGITGPSSEDPRRDSIRLPQQSLRSNLGEVLDLSEHGMRVASDRKLTGPVDVHLFTLDKSLNLKGRITWTKIVGQFKYELGVQFNGITRRDVKQIASLASTCRKRRRIA